MSSYSRLLTLASAILQHPAIASLPPAHGTTLQSHVALSLPWIKPISSDLDSLQCSQQATSMLETVFEDACTRLATNCDEAFAMVKRELETSSPAACEESVNNCLVAMVAAVTRQFREDTDSVRRGILEAVLAAKRRHSSHVLPHLSLSATLSSKIPRRTPNPISDLTPEPTGSFTAEVVSILQKAFDTSDTLTRAEVKGLIGVTGLSTKQIRTWFANQRQRRGRKAAPYIPPRRPTSQRHSIPLRNVSDSSTSSSSSLISYDETSSSDLSPPPRHDPLHFPFPAVVANHSFEEDSQMGDSPSSELPSAPVFPVDAANPWSVGAPIPPAPSTADTDRFFSAQQQLPLPSPPLSHSHSNALFDLKYTDTSSEDTSFLDHLQRTDPFLDDEFLKNVFGTLGVTQAGGLTLCMDSFRDEVAGASAAGGAGAGLASRGGEGAGGNGMSFGW